MPEALESAVWVGVPNSAPKDIPSDQVIKFAYERLETNALIGRKAGVRLVDSVYAFTALAVGDQEKVKQVITHFAQSRKVTPSAPRWRLLDETSAAQLQFISDHFWTQKTGHRNQYELGRFWEEEESSQKDESEEDSLLDELDEE